jgi:glucose-1-phosphate adenylyltransferase
MITDGCVIASGARIERSILSPGVSVGPDALIRDSVVLTDCAIAEGARVERAILDKLVRIDKGARIGGRRRESEGNGREAVDSGITTVGKDAHIPAGIRVARGAVVAADATPEYFENAATALRARRRRGPATAAPIATEKQA